MSGKNIFFILFFLITSCCFSQNPVFRQYTVEDGLPGNEIYHIIQDNKGFIWIATSNGVSRFDGNRFENFTVENGLPDNEVLKMREDDNGRIWFISFTGPLSYYDGKVHNAGNTDFLQRLRFKNIVQSFTPVNEHEILIADRNNSTYLLRDTLLQHYDSLVYSSIIRQNDGSILFLGRNSISEKLNERETFRLEINLISFNGHAEYDKITNRTLAVIDSGILCYQKGKLSHIRNSNKFTQSHVRFISCDEEGYIWLGTDDGCFRILLDQKNEVTHFERFFEGYAVSSVFQDKDHNFWVATRGDGLLMVPSLNVRLFNKASGFSDNNVTAAIRTADHKIICGTMNGFLYTLDEDNRISETTNLKSARIRKMISDRSGRIYIACEGGIFILSNHRFQNILSSYSNSIKSMTLSSGDDNILAGGLLAIVRIKNNTAKDTLVCPSSEMRFYSICERTADELWLATEKGLYVWKDRHLLPFHHERKSFAGWIDEICKTRDGKLLITTRDSGLAIVSENAIEFIHAGTGLQSNTCNSLYYDSLKDAAYIGTNKGLSVVSFGKNGTREIKNYNSSNGLDCGSIYSIFESEGEIILSTNKGLLVCREDDLNTGPETPKVHLTSVEINGMDVPLQPTYQLKFRQNNIRIIYQGVAFRNNKELEYRYQLDPLDTGWNVTSSGAIIYSDLKPGDYRFNVQVRSGNQWHGDSTSSVSFLISPPSWQTWWFRILSAVVLSVIVVSFYNLRIHRIRKKQQIENELLQTELKALRAQINPHFIFNSLNSIQDFIFRNEKEEANSYLSKFASLMRMILDNSSKKYISLHDEIRFINSYVELESLRFGGRFRFVLLVEEDINVNNCFLPPMILQPYVENAILHGLAQKKSDGILAITFKSENNFIVCIIEDNGMGRKKSELQKSPDMKAAHHSFAMKATNERIEAINKSEQHSIEYRILDLADESGLTSGTKIILKFPQAGESRLS